MFSLIQDCRVSKRLIPMSHRLPSSGEAAPDVAAPELLKKDAGINCMEDLQKVYIYHYSRV